MFRDGHKCRQCGKKGDLTVHHIKPWAKYPNLRYAIYNGTTLCKRCHRLRHEEDNT